MSVVSQPTQRSSSQDSEQSVVSVVSQPTQQSSSQDSEQSVVSVVSQPTQRSSSQEQAAQQNECDDDICRDFLRRTCGCKKAGGEPCSSLFSVEHYITLRAQSALLSRTELDMVLLGSLMSTTLDDSHTIKDGRHKDAKRRKMSSNFMHHGHNVCKVTFAFLYGVGINHRVLALRKHYQENGMETRVHQNSKQTPAQALSFDDINRIVKYLNQYVEQHAILLPGRIPGQKRDDVKLLPSSSSKRVKINQVLDIILSIQSSKH